jgi:hypothetical protein
LQEPWNFWGREYVIIERAASWKWSDNRPGYTKNFAGLRDSFTFGLAAQVRKPRAQHDRPCGLFAEPQRLHFRRFAAKHKGFLAQVVNRAAPNHFLIESGKKKEQS